MTQERELEDKQRTEQRQLLVVQIRQQILATLESIKFQRGTGGVARDTGEDRGRPRRDRAVALEGALVNGRLELPWENDQRALRFGQSLDDPGFARLMQEAERKEFVAHDYTAAARGYHAAISSAPELAQKAYARLLKARALRKSGQRGESVAEYEAVLASPTGLVDEHGIPLALYAGLPLIEAGMRRQEILKHIRDAVGSEYWLSPRALYLVRDLLTHFDAPDLDTTVSTLLQDAAQAAALQRDSARLLAIINSGEPMWIAHGSPVWLVSMTRRRDTGEGLVIAVRASEVLATVNSGSRPVHVASAAETSAEALGETFPGLRLVLPTGESSAGGSRQALLVTALALAVAFTLLAGYLLWRDVQREVRLADLRSQFVSSVTHELKTPLTAIRMFTETLRLDEEVDHQTRSEYLDTILYESERLSRLVDNVLDFGKIERGTKLYRFGPVRLDEVVDGAARAIQHPLEQAGFSLAVSVDRDLPLVSADSDALRQAILNLLTNAMKYSGDSRRIRLALTRQNGDAHILVVDEGIGIAPENHARIFEKFYRAPSAANEHIQGAGLGLTLVTHIVSAHGGDVRVDSSPGTGSSFVIRLPLTDREEERRVTLPA